MAKNVREKAAKIAAEREKRPFATAKYIRISPSKVHIVLDVIRGQDYYTALAILKNTPKAASEVLVKVLESAGANAENNLNLSKNDLYVAECYANEGPTYKRYWMRSHGSADVIKKRTSHITIILDDKANTAKPEVKKVEAKKVVEEKSEPVTETVKVEEKASSKAKTAEKKTEAKKPAAKTTKTTKTADAKKESKQGGEK